MRLPVIYRHMMTQYFIILLLNKRVCDVVHAVHGTDEVDGGASTHHEHEPQVPRVPGQLVRVVRVAEMLDGIVQHGFQQWVKPLECPATLPASGELDPDLLVDEPAELED